MTAMGGTLRYFQVQAADGTYIGCSGIGSPLEAGNSRSWGYTWHDLDQVKKIAAGFPGSTVVEVLEDMDDTGKLHTMIFPVV
jgi:hypothetical protein